MEQLKKIPIVYYSGELGFFKGILSSLYFLDIRAIKWEDVMEKCKNSIIETLVLDENFFYKNSSDRTGKYRIQFDQLVALLNKNCIGSLMIYNHHPMLMEKEKLKKIDEIAKHMKISMLVCGEYDFDLKNIKIKNQDTWEIGLHSHWVKALSMMLLKKRKPQVDFMLSTTLKDEFRKEIVNGLSHTDVNIVANNKSEFLWKKIEDVSKGFLKKLGDFQLVDYDHNTIVKSLITIFGNGPPNFDLYEKHLCELVIETANAGSWHLTEKTYRPIAFGIPIIFLGHKPMFDCLVKKGYQFHDNNFYVHWHSDIPLQQKINYLKFFLQSLKNDESRKKLLETASHNYSLYWNHIKFNHLEEQYNFFNDFFGDDFILKEVYDIFNF